MSSITSLARYPFTSDAMNMVKELDFKIDELTSPEYGLLILRAKERIEHAIKYAEVQGFARKDLVELLSFPTAIFLISCLKNKPLTRRYALAEAKRTYKSLIADGPANMKKIAKEFSWYLVDFEDPHLRFGIHFTNYLSNSLQIKESRWRLINRKVEGGLVLLTEGETARLLQEEIRQRIEKRIMESEAVPPATLRPTLTELENRFNYQFQEEPILLSAKKAVFSALPPCIKSLYRDLISGKNLSHIERFVLTSFLFNIGATSDDILKLFKRAADFDIEKARYQVEHIGGLRGSSIKYSPPKCGTLRTHGLCRNPDDTCKKIPHPLKYYRFKLRSVKQVKESGGSN